MENFGNIKDTFKGIVIESVLKKDKNGKKLFSKFIRIIKEDNILSDQYLIYKNLQTKKFDDPSEAKDYIKENISLLKTLDKKKLEKGNKKLFNLLNGKDIVKENNEFYNHIKILVETEKTPSTIEKINDSINHIKRLMLEKDVEIKNDRIDSELPPSVLTKIAVNKFNNKYSNISESEKEIIKTILNGNNETKEETYNSLKRECIDIIDSRLSESSDIDLKDKLLRVKDKLLNMNFDTENFISDINKVYDLKQSVSSSVE
jgi:hypothetical protein